MEVLPCSLSISVTNSITVTRYYHNCYSENNDYDYNSSLVPLLFQLLFSYCYFIASMNFSPHSISCSSFFLLGWLKTCKKSSYSADNNVFKLFQNNYPFFELSLVFNCVQDKSSAAAVWCPMFFIPQDIIGCCMEVLDPSSWD